MQAIDFHRLGLRLGVSDVQHIVEWMVTQQPEQPPSALKLASLLYAMRRFGIRTFVETGTYMGDTAAAMAQFGNQVITIELSAELHEKACARFADNPLVRCERGDSGDLLPAIIARLDAPAMFWLDGHYSGGFTAKGERDTPLMQELEALAAARQERPALIDGSAVFIDDARLFGDGDYPSVEEMREFAKRNLPRHAVSLVHDALRIIPVE